ncbi:hypothetical protein [Bradyrhizobium sp. 8-10B]|uniref:hypothetical protein n=1 Tax=Bradyrhizobium sp. 8-10B TaxID=3344579 RepID=UPI0035BF4ADB
MDDLLERLHAKENEIARLTGALLRISAIKNELDGDDWSEIEQARTIARTALRAPSEEARHG